MANLVDKAFGAVLESLPEDNPLQDSDWPSPENPDDWDSDDEIYDEADTWSLDDPDGSSDRRRPFIDEGYSDESREETRELIEGGLRSRGLDALAFYKSRRFIHERPFYGRWGIFYLKAGLDYIATEISHDYPGYGDPYKLAHGFLHAHEFFHYKSDIQTLLFETVLKRHLYRPLHRLLKRRRSLFVEEALANREVWKWSKSKPISIEDFARRFMDLQPGAYARYAEDELTLAGEWVANTLDLVPPGSPPRLDLARWVHSVPQDYLRASLCPQYVVRPTRLKYWISPARLVPPVTAIHDGPKVQKLLSGKYSNLEAAWSKTKDKLLKDRLLRGLDFKKWPKVGNRVYSVRVDDNFRAHLENQGSGEWEALDIGGHTAMGHG
jgi:hypothetical protein